MEPLLSEAPPTVPCLWCQYPVDFEQESCSNCGSPLEFEEDTASTFSLQELPNLAMRFSEGAMIASLGVFFVYLSFRVSPLIVMFPLLIVFSRGHRI